MASQTAPRRKRRPWNQTKPRWRYTDAWDAKCPNPECGYEFDQDDPDCRCPIDNSKLVVRKVPIERPWELKDFFIKAFRFSRMLVGEQELRCAANDGHLAISIGCPICDGPVQGHYLRGIHLVPRLSLYVPFVLLLSLGVVRATCGIGFLLWPFITSFFGWIYILLFCHPWWPRLIRYVFNKDAAFSFYETNEAPALVQPMPEHERGSSCRD